MADILSQDEIDSLLSSLDDQGDSSGGGEDGSAGSSQESSDFDKHKDKNITLYDFRRPDRVSKDQLRTLQNLHENYMRSLSTSFTTILRTLVELELLSVDQLTYQEFIMSLPNPSAIFLFEMQPFEGNAIFEMNLELVYMMIEKLFGGKAQSSSVERSLTSMETGMMRWLVNKALKSYSQAWEHIVEISAKLGDFESNPQFVQIIPPTEIVILVSFEVRLEEEMSGMMSLCLPYMLLEPIMENLSEQTWAHERDAGEQLGEDIVNIISDRELTISAILGEQEISIRDLLQLQNGDIITLNKKEDRKAEVYIGGKNKMQAKIGLLGNKRAIEIKKIYKGDENYE